MNGPNTAPRGISEAIQLFWLFVIGIGDPGASKMGKLGDVHPRIVPVIVPAKLTEKTEEKLITVTNDNHQ